MDILMAAPGRENLIKYNLQFFAKQGPGGAKTEEPTSKRLQDARKKGQVAKSQEISIAADLLAFFVMLRFLLSFMGLRILNVFQKIYNDIPHTIRMEEGRVPVMALKSSINSMIINVGVLILPFLLIGCAIVLLANYLQIGFKVTWEPMKPKFNKLSPISGFKRIFSVQSLFNLLKAILKITLLSVVVYITVKGREESIFLLYDIPLKQAIAFMGDLIIEIGIKCSAVYFLIAAIDFIYQKRKFHEDMKMTKQEVKDEYKNSEGDPAVKAKQKQKMREASQRRMMQNLPKADVVITNPTHYAVAIAYDQDNDPAPRVIAKGADHIAMKIREAAAENNIEIVENKPLARMLYSSVDIGEFIPPELYKAVAEVLAYVYKLKGRV
ncbi:flagellar biosynthesis protein FlhB [Butyrivibrio sp. MC2013]|uniref:flagellar biosynthesis protein FlhB n=1 Tax=Butyrivibrio sp. MC2013 TaxID=1280686 RepID=UPI00041249E8|nr:flagellar biosynthesis protein FlhB [Butyrivibrio sp. MC2013]